MSVFRRRLNFLFRAALLPGLVIIHFNACKKETLAASPQLADIKAGILLDLNALRISGCNCGPDSMPAVKPVLWSNELQKAAADHAQDMYNKNYFNHVSPQGISPGDWANREGYSAISLGENIAQNYATIDETIAAWKNSPEHCTVMMDSVYREIGAAKYGNYWVVLLGRR